MPVLDALEVQHQLSVRELMTVRDPKPTIESSARGTLPKCWLSSGTPKTAFDPWLILTPST